jgi:hypothetical protein
MGTEDEENVLETVEIAKSLNHRWWGSNQLPVSAEGNGFFRQASNNPL